MSNSNYLDEVKNTPADEMMSIGKLSVLGLQQVLAMFASSIAIPIIVSGALKLPLNVMAILIASSCFATGICTAFQSIGLKRYLGIRLPIVLGCGMASVAPILLIINNLSSNIAGGGSGLSIDQSVALRTVFGATIIAGIVAFLVAPILGRLSSLFSKIVIGCLLLTVGSSLFNAALNNIVGVPNTPSYGNAQNIWIALITLLAIVLLYRFVNQKLRSVAILFGILIGFVVSIFAGIVNFAPVINAGWIGLPQPFKFGAPIFTNINADLLLIIVSLINSIEAIGCFSVVSNLCGSPMPTKRMISGLRAEGICVAFSGMFNSFSLTSFSSNIGILLLSGIRSRWTTFVGGIILVAFGLIPKTAAFITIIPSCVLGAGILAICGSVLVAGIINLKQVNLDYYGNVITIAISVGVGVAFNGKQAALSQMPTFVKDILPGGVICTVIIAVLLNLLFNFKEIKENFKALNAKEKLSVEKAI
ncbi:solute carrier family 23 protein [Desulfosporosinus sp. PR]|uniref:uracil-xanthine permease family protein n=1 Tax=Candidatus Desulfosporosinus nitrosoreducens TaxID=3401928 RepID=UPI0027E60785|nr:solute carrier family 23 protein [Desulfosporosinus sp. PR]MDQ7096653.1 solute carrier family 23 protein [Desulfosporosinus sp. PR]